jgi:hypothetical protein
MWESTRYKKRRRRLLPLEEDKSTTEEVVVRTDAKQRAENARGLRLRRAEAQLVVVGEEGAPASLINARVVLNDFFEKSVTLFSTEPLELDQVVQLVMHQPRRFHARGVVVSCARPLLSARVFSSRLPMAYRIQLEFFFNTGDERAAMRDFCEAVARALRGRA